MAAELSDADVFGTTAAPSSTSGTGSGTPELSDAQVFGPPAWTTLVSDWAKRNLAQSPPAPGTPTPGAPGSPAYGPPAPTVSDQLKDLLAPAPDTTYGELPLTWAARDDKTGQIRFAMPSSIRNTLLDFLQGPGAETTVDPATGKISYGMSPSANLLLGAGAGLGGRDLAFSGDNPFAIVPKGTYTPAPRVTLEDLTASIRRADGAPPPAEVPPVPPVTPPSSVLTHIWASADHDFPVTPTGVERTAPDGRVYAEVQQPGGTTGYVPKDELRATQPTAPAAPPAAEAPPVPTVPGAIPKTSAEAKQVASQFYQLNAEQGGRTMPPDFINALSDDLNAAGPKGPLETAVAGDNRVGNIATQVQKLRDTPTTLEDAQRTYSRIGDEATAEFKQNGNSETYRDLMQIQANMRDRIAPPDLAGDDAWTNARKAWSQAMKMQDLENIQERANLTDNPATSIRTQLRTMLTNPARMRGYSTDEVSALEDAANRGVIGGLLHVFGSRLVPVMAAGAEMGSHGLAAGLLAGGTTHLGTTALRAGATALQNRRLTNAMAILGRNVPQNALMQPPAP